MEKIKKCPNCGGEEVYWYAGAITGSYQCRKCGYIGPLVVEETRIRSAAKRAGKRKKKPARSRR